LRGLRVRKMTRPSRRPSPSNRPILISCIEIGRFDLPSRGPSLQHPLFPYKAARADGHASLRDITLALGCNHV